MLEYLYSASIKSSKVVEVYSMSKRVLIVAVAPAATAATAAADHEHRPSVRSSVHLN